MASTEASVKFPSIESLKVTVKEVVAEGPGEQDRVKTHKLNKAKSFLSGLQLGSLQRQKRPGDVWGSAGVARQPRPLGLIPDRHRFDSVRELSRLLPPLTLYTRRVRVPGVNAHSDQRVNDGEPLRVDDENNHVNKNEEVISATVKHTTEYQQDQTYSPALVADGPPPSSLLGMDNPSVPFRYSQSRHGNQPYKEQQPVRGRDEMDQDYLDTLAKCNLGDYYPQVSRPQTLPPINLSGEQLTSNVQMVKGGRRLPRVGRPRSRSSGPRFMSFSGQSQLWDRSLSDDRRVPLGYEPCERCRERGGRCARCKALRVGGGYIILDGDDLSDEEHRKRFGKRYGLGSVLRSSVDSGDRQTGRRLTAGDVDSLSGLKWGEGDDGSDGRQRGMGNVGGVGGGGWGGLDGGDRKTSGGGDGRLTSASNQGQFGVSVVKGSGDKSGLDRRGRGHSQGDDSNTTSGDRRGGGDSDGGGRRRRDGGGDGDGREGGDGEMSGRASSRGISRMSDSRPGSTLGSRPASSLRRKGGLDRRDRGRKNVDVEGGFGGGRSRRRGGSGSDDSGDEDGRGRRRRKKGGGGEDDEGGDDDNRERSKYKFKSSREDEDERPMSGYHGNLMRFKRKKDDVKVIHATLNELQGIDPLDYLAKYCIIDQTKLPHYQHCFDNVDRDEDDEIDINELDFALKAVNYDLITDTEMNYVHSVLELAGRYRLNFRLFSLIAALSEKVVALEDMVKRLINKMDFEALEVKMKKCKELFYLLADSESKQQHEGGVVTTGSLSVELQAGGLTQDHVEFVADRLNHEGKGLVEFLDYLTYVPLFVEIHDSISGNPLDFSRTK